MITKSYKFQVEGSVIVNATTEKRARELLKHHQPQGFNLKLNRKAEQ